VVTVVLAASLLGSCVSKKRYETDIASERARADAIKQQLEATAEHASTLQADVATLERALAEMQAREDIAKARVAAYQDLVARFATLIDAGTLRVQIVDGKMVVNIGTDILFPSGSAELSKEGQSALPQVGAVLAQLPENVYQVEGHTDNVPIKTAKYPSNWELASARATTVVKTLTAAGIAPSNISAASFAEFKPAASNDTPEGKQQNRRIEIVVVPDLSKLPGFEELNALADSEGG
jgi:chemotaxis protein MotB